MRNNKAYPPHLLQGLPPRLIADFLVIVIQFTVYLWAYSQDCLWYIPDLTLYTT